MVLFMKYEVMYNGELVCWYVALKVKSIAQGGMGEVTQRGGGGGLIPTVTGPESMLT